MPNFSGSPTEDDRHLLFPAHGTGLWLIPQIAVVVAFAILVGYAFQQGWLSSPPWGQHGAPATQAPAATPRP